MNAKTSDNHRNVEFQVSIITPNLGGVFKLGIWHLSRTVSR
jgi:hypothetical protein